MEHFNRVELKYLINVKDYICLRNDLSNLLSRDENSQQGPYNVYSIYFDTPSLEYYFDKIDGFENRQKYRLRFYQDPLKLEKNNFVALEIKEKRNNVIFKKRQKIEISEASQILNVSNKQEYDFLSPDFRDFYIDRLVPVVQTNYKREAFFQKNNSRLRVTFDFNNHALLYNRFSRKIIGIPKYFFDNDYGILEIKSFDGIPKWLMSRIQSYGFAQKKISKYCMAVDCWYEQINLYGGVSSVG